MFGFLVRQDILHCQQIEQATEISWDRFRARPESQQKRWNSTGCCHERGFRARTSSFRLSFRPHVTSNSDIDLVLWLSTLLPPFMGVRKVVAGLGGFLYLLWSPRTFVLSFMDEIDWSDCSYVCFLFSLHRHRHES